MPFIIDGYNLYHAACKGHSEWASLTPDALCRLIAADMARRRDRAVVVFDGTRTLAATESVGSPSVIEVRYAGGGVTADSVIIEAMAACHSPRTWTVVSSDRVIRRSVRRRRAVSLGAGDYLDDMVRRLNRPHRGPAEPAVKFDGLSPDQTDSTDAWLEAFGYDPSQIPAKPSVPVPASDEPPAVDSPPPETAPAAPESPEVSNAPDPSPTHNANKSLDQRINELLGDHPEWL